MAVTGHAREALQPLGDLISSERVNPQYAEHGNVYSLWCARDVVSRGCYIVNCDVLFGDAIARTLVSAAGSCVLCAADHGVDAESMKAVAGDGRLEALSKDAPVGPHPEYIGLARIDPAHGPALAEALERFVREGAARRVLRGRASRSSRAARTWASSRSTGSPGSRSTTTRTSRRRATRCSPASREGRRTARRRAAPPRPGGMAALHGAAALPARRQRPAGARRGDRGARRRASTSTASRSSAGRPSPPASHASCPARCRGRAAAPVGVEANTESEVARLAAAARAARGRRGRRGRRRQDDRRRQVRLRGGRAAVDRRADAAHGGRHRLSRERDPRHRGAPAQRAGPAADRGCGRPRGGRGARRPRVPAPASETCSPTPVRCTTGTSRPRPAGRRWTTSPRCCRRAPSTWSTPPHPWHWTAGRRPSSSCIACCAAWC